MALPVAYLLIWGCIKLVISDKTVNTAVDHWTKGTSTKLDDLLWKLLELAAGIEDEDLKELTLNAGVADLNARYDSAKAAGREHEFKQRTTPPISQTQIMALLTTDQLDVGNC